MKTQQSQSNSALPEGVPSGVEGTPPVVDATR